MAERVASSSESSSDDTTEAELGAVNTVTIPYQDEPLAPVHEEGDNQELGLRFDEEGDEDGIPLRTIEMRYDGVQSVDEWYVNT